MDKNEQRKLLLKQQQRAFDLEDLYELMKEKGSKVKCIKFLTSHTDKAEELFVVKDDDIIQNVLDKLETKVRVTNNELIQANRKGIIQSSIKSEAQKKREAEEEVKKKEDGSNND